MKLKGAAALEKPVIKAAFVDFAMPFEKIQKTLFYRLLEKNYDIEQSDDPDYVFGSSFGLLNSGVLKYRKAVRIFISFENLWPDFDLYDYAVTCYPLQYGDRHLIHPYCFDHGDCEKSILSTKNKHLTAKDDFTIKTGFCSFVVSNNLMANPIREEFFNRLCNYKKVDSGGKFRNNIGQKDGVKDKLTFASARKFSLVFENCRVDNYITEKILEGFAAHTIPIYWGSPEVKKIFNPEAFIYIDGREDFGAAIEKIKYLDNNDEAYSEMLSQPALLDPDIAERTFSQTEEFFRHIIEQPLETAYRRPLYGFSLLKERQMLRAAKVAGPLKKCTLAARQTVLKMKHLIHTIGRS